MNYLIDQETHNTHLERVCMRSKVLGKFEGFQSGRTSRLLDEYEEGALVVFEGVDQINYSHQRIQELGRGVSHSCYGTRRGRGIKRRVDDES